MIIQAQIQDPGSRIKRDRFMPNKVRASHGSLIPQNEIFL